MNIINRTTNAPTQHNGGYSVANDVHWKRLKKKYTTATSQNNLNRIRNQTHSNMLNVSRGAIWHLLLSLWALYACECLEDCSNSAWHRLLKGFWLKRSIICSFASLKLKLMFECLWMPNTFSNAFFAWDPSIQSNTIGSVLWCWTSS